MTITGSPCQIGPARNPLLLAKFAPWKTGASLSLATGLDLTARSLDEPVCAQLLARLELRWPRRIIRLLMTPAVVVRSQGAGRRGVIWRRRTLRQMLKSRR